MNLECILITLKPLADQQRPCMSLDFKQLYRDDPCSWYHFFFRAGVPLSCKSNPSRAMKPQLLELQRHHITYQWGFASPIKVPVPAYYLRLLQKRAAMFVWDRLKPRVPENTLYLRKLWGGLSFPNFTTYYKVAHMVSLPKNHATHEIPLWVAIESVDCNLLAVSNLLWLCPTDQSNLRNPVTEHFISLWDRLKLHHSPHNPPFSSSKTQPFVQLGSLQQRSIDGQH